MSKHVIWLQTFKLSNKFCHHFMIFYGLIYCHFCLCLFLWRNKFHLGIHVSWPNGLLMTPRHEQVLIDLCIFELIHPFVINPCFITIFYIFIHSWTELTNNMIKPWISNIQIDRLLLDLVNQKVKFIWINLCSYKIIF